MNLSKVIIAPDSFKGAMTSKQVTDIIASEVEKAFSSCMIVKMPIADGGEGSVDTILSSIGGKKHEARVISPDERQITASYGIAKTGEAILEMAQSSGITKQNGLHPMTSTTYGFGQLIKAALDRGAREFMLGIGGSATTDGGCGMACALGVKFINRQGNSFIPSGETLKTIEKIDMEKIDKRVAKSTFTVMCDVDNPLFGEKGAAYVYGPQKGASSKQVITLDEGLRHLGAVLNEHFGEDYSAIPGTGAAGGLGAGCIAFLGAQLKSGIEAILKLCDFEKQIKDADLIITGEGKLDTQSFQGKVLSGLTEHSKDVPVWIICGVCDYKSESVREEVHKRNLIVFETSEGITAEESINEPEKYLRIAAKKLTHQLSKSASGNNASSKNTSSKNAPGTL